MNITVRKYSIEDLSDMIQIWNEVVEEGIAFPQEECLNEETGKCFFESQSYCAVAEDTVTKKSMDSTSYIPIMLEDADTSVIPAMPSILKAEGCISAKSWYRTL